MTLPHVKYRNTQPSRKSAYWNPAASKAAGNFNRLGTLNQHQVEQLARFNHDGMKRHKFHQEREVLMANIKRKQKISTYEGERDRFEHARIHGALSAEQNARLEQLKNLLGK